MTPSFFLARKIILEIACPCAESSCGLIHVKRISEYYIFYLICEHDLLTWIMEFVFMCLLYFEVHFDPVVVVNSKASAKGYIGHNQYESTAEPSKCKTSYQGEVLISN